MDYRVEYLESRKKNLVVKINGYLLHSKYDPVEEAKRICEKEYVENYVHVIFGYGMGYIINELNRFKKNNESIIIVDPLKEVLNIDNNEVLSVQDLKLFKETLANNLEHYSREIKVICSPNYDKIAPESYKAVLKIVKDIQMSNIVFNNTIQLFGERWQENSIHNINLLAEDQPLSILFKTTNKPIIIASGGPSLIKQLPLLKEIKGKVILFAAGSAINSLLQHNIIPDYVVSIDGGEANYNHFKNIESKGTSLIYSVSSHYKIQQEWKNDRFIFAGIEDEDLKNKVKKKYNVDLPLIVGGGSVANYCYSIAIKMTSGPIAFIGQDLAYTNLQSHAEGNRGAKTVNEDYLLKRGAFKTIDYKGEEIYTDYAFDSMRESFEDLAINYPHESGIYNCTEGGISVQGFKNYTFKKFIVDFVEDNVSVDIKRDFLPVVEWRAIKNEFNNEIKLYSILEEVCFKVVLSMKRDFQKKYFSKETLKLLKLTDARIKEIVENELMIQSIMEPLIKQVLTEFKGNSEENEIQKFERVYYQNIKWYSGIEEVMRKMKQFTINAIEQGDEKDARIKRSS